MASTKPITRPVQWNITIRPSVFSTLHETLQATLSDRLGWDGLREVQEEAYRAICKGNDVLVIAPTASGKSESALIPVLDDILKSGSAGVSCLYIAPLKALINDQEERVASFCRPAGLSLSLWHGDVAKKDRRWSEDDAPQFLLTTPESLEIILHEPAMVKAFANLKYVIVDELHAFVESERGAHLNILLDRLDRVTGKKVQRIGLSATVGNPDEVLEWFSGNRWDTKLVAIPAPPTKKKFLFVIEPDADRKMDALVRMVSGKKALVFVNSRATAETIMQEVSGRVPNLYIHHSSLSQSKRRNAEEAFHGDEGACIICTSTLELGIDIGDLDIVVQVGPPDSVSSFLQRMGRSGRRKKDAFVAWILTDPHELLTSCAVIECAQARLTEPLKPIRKPWNVLAQQILLGVLSVSRVGRGRLIRDLLSYQVFTCFSAEDIDTLISHLVVSGYLLSDGEILMLGQNTEREYGKAHYQDLYSMIQGGGEIRAVTPDGEIVGNLDARFAHQKEPGDFTLGGTTWSVVKCDETHNLVVVVPGSNSKNGSRIFWSSGDETAMSPVICNGIQHIVARGKTTLPLNPGDTETLNLALREYAAGISQKGFFVQATRGIYGKEIIVYSFLGSRFNRVLASSLKGVLGRGQVRYDDERVRIYKNKSLDSVKVAAALQDIPSCSMDEISQFLQIPAARQWKFAHLLLDHVFREMVMDGYYHVDEVFRTLRDSLVTVLPDDPALKMEK